MLNKHIGGTEQASLDYLKLLSNKGHELSYVYTKKSWTESQIKKLCSSSEIRISDSIGLTPILQKYNPAAIYKLKKFISLKQPDIIISHGGNALYIAIRTANNKFPVVSVTHLNKHYKKHPPFAYFPLCKQIQEKLSTEGNYTLDYLPLVPNTTFDKVEKSTKVDKNKFVFGSFGRLDFNKGFDRILKAFSVASSMHPNCHLLIGGFGNEKSKLINLAQDLNISDKISWTTVEPNEESRKSFFSKIDVFVLASRSEMFPLVVLEAMTKAVPIITSPVGACRDVFTNQRNALIFEDIKDLIAHMNWSVSHPLEMNKIGRNGQILFTNNYSPSRVSRQIESACFQVISLWNKDR